MKLLYSKTHYKPTIIIILHVLFGFLSSQSSLFSTFWAWAIFVLGSYDIIITKNKNNEVAVYSAYLVSLEIILRMTKASVFWEFGKYGVIFFIMLGFIINRDKRHKISPFIFFYLLFLLPSLIFTLQNQSFELWRRTISFNLSGPMILITSSIYFRNRLINRTQIVNIFRMFMLPVVSLIIIIIIRAPSYEDIEFTSEANFQLSGGYGPNQVSSILGLGIFIIALSKILSLKLFFNLIEYTLLGFSSILGYLTFARGGILSAIISIMTITLVAIGKKGRKTLRAGKIFYIIAMLIIFWNIGVNFSEGMVIDRYRSLFEVSETGYLSGSGRILIMLIDLEIFYDNLLFGVGPGQANQLRKDYGYGKFVTAHSEFTRLLSEHGILGLLSILCIILMTLIDLKKRNREEKCIQLGLALLALLTMSHSAMRLAMPGFIFGLAFIRTRKLN